LINPNEVLPIPVARSIVPEVKALPSIFASTAVDAKVVVSTFSSILYQVLKDSADDVPIVELSSKFLNSSVRSVFNLMPTFSLFATFRKVAIPVTELGAVTI